jgi:hypothetical protein
VREAGADRPVDPDEVDLDDALEGVGVHRAHEARRGDAGVGEDRVDAAERLDRPGHCGFERIAVGDVGVEDERAGAVGRDRAQLLGPEPHERDARAARGEASRDLRPDAVGGASDEDGLAGQGCHGARL